jgi:hypothetical protein
MHIFAVKETLIELKEVLVQLSNQDFIKPVNNLGDSSIGEHSRHVIELFQCLLNSYENGKLNYDKRERNISIQSDVKFANNAIDVIIETIDKPNRNIVLEQIINGQSISIQTNYFRELLYNLEHCIHHQALIKVALFHIENIKVNATFGVAPSTTEYKNKCAQ